MGHWNFYLLHLKNGRWDLWGFGSIKGIWISEGPLYIIDSQFILWMMMIMMMNLDVTKLPTRGPRSKYSICIPEGQQDWDQIWSRSIQSECAVVHLG